VVRPRRRKAGAYIWSARLSVGCFVLELRPNYYPGDDI